MCHQVLSSPNVIKMQLIPSYVLCLLSPCSNVMCGQLFCELGEYQYVIYSVYVLTVDVYIPSLEETVKCQ